MKRLAAILLFAGAVLFSTHILAPAAPSHPRLVVSSTDLAAIIQAKPIVDEVNAQVDRLRERLARPPEYPAPTRDPFRFGKRAEPTPPKAAKPALAPALVMTPAISAPVLPRLVAIVSNATDSGLLRSAVLASGDDVHIVKSGESIGKLVVRSIGVDAVELADPVSGVTFKISLQ